MSLEASEGVIQGDNDPVVSPREWYSEFHAFHNRLVAESPDFDYRLLKETEQRLYGIVKSLEDQIDALGPARLSEVMAVLREWRDLLLTAYFEQRQGNRPG